MAPRRVDRRAFLQRSAQLLGAGSVPAVLGRGAVAFGQAPAIVTSEAARPSVAQGVQAGDAGLGQAIVWSRTDRPARMIVEYDTSDRFANVRRVVGPYALPVSDFTTRIDLTGLPAGQDIFYRVRYQDLGSLRTFSEPALGRFRTAPALARTVKFVWSADTCGQGYGINPDWGGMKTYEAMRREQPDFFIHSGDTIYADGPLQAERKVEDGRLWRNIVTEAKSKVAETLDEYRGNYLYNLMDEHVRRFNADVAQIWQWDDHEVLNNWSPGKDLSGHAGFTEKSVSLLAARATRAFLEYAPMRWHGPDESERVYRHIPYGPLLDVFVIDMRSYRGPNTYNRQDSAGPETVLMGAAQVEWLTREITRSRATWKIVASDMPLARQVEDDRDQQGRTRSEAVANGDGPALGRELEMAGLLGALKREGASNVVWLTGDVHFTAAHFYDPSKARFTDFDPFWEFVSGPIHAGGGIADASRSDNTFGQQVVYQRSGGPSPYDDKLYFGTVVIDAKTRALSVALKDGSGVIHFSTTLEPRRA